MRTVALAFLVVVFAGCGADSVTSDQQQAVGGAQSELRDRSCRNSVAKADPATLFSDEQTATLDMLIDGKYGRTYRGPRANIVQLKDFLLSRIAAASAGGGIQTTLSMAIDNEVSFRDRAISLSGTSADDAAKRLSDAIGDSTTTSLGFTDVTSPHVSPLTTCLCYLTCPTGTACRPACDYGSGLCENPDCTKPCTNSLQCASPLLCLNGWCWDGGSCGCMGLSNSCTSSLQCCTGLVCKAGRCQ